MTAWELKLGKKTSSQTSPLVRGMGGYVCCLPTSRKTFSIAVDDKGQKRKAQGGERVLVYVSHHACWDAKNRYGLPGTGAIQLLIHCTHELMESQQEKAEVRSPQPTYQVEKPKTTQPVPEPTQQAYTAGEKMNLPLNEPVKQEEQKAFPAQDPGIPKALRDLMEENHVDEWGHPEM